MSTAPWIRVLYPFQWGTPIFKAGHCFKMIKAALVAFFESTGTFFEAARLSGAITPPSHVLTRSVGLQNLPSDFTRRYLSNKKDNVILKISNGFRSRCCLYVLTTSSKLHLKLYFT